MERARKIKEVREFGEKFREVESFFLADFIGMTVTQMTRIRKELRKINGEFKVVKNSVLRIASNGTPVERLKEKFVGPNAIILAPEEPSKVAKLLISLSKDIPNFKIKGGYLRNHIIEPEDVNRLATLPSKEMLFGQLLGLLKGPQIRLVNALSFNLVRLLGILNAIKEKKEKG